MVKGRFAGDDIEIYLSEEEVIGLGLLEIKDRKLKPPTLEVILDVVDGSAQLKARIQNQKFDSLGDGIEVERTDYGFFVKINDSAYWRMRDSFEEGRELLAGTRYDGSNKINFWKEQAFL